MTDLIDSVQLKARERALIQTLITHMKIEGFVPACIVGLSRGGLVPAIILSHVFDVQMVPIMWSARDHAMELLPYVVIEHLRGIAERGGQILVVDDIADSGKSFLTLRREFDDFSSSVRWAALYQRDTSEFVCDFEGEILTSADWVDFSWELEANELNASNRTSS